MEKNQTTLSFRLPTDEPTPYLALDLDQLDTNLGRMAATASAAGVALRPHVKTHRTSDIARLQIDSGAVGICTAKISEAEALADAGLNDITVAYPLIDDQRLPRAVALSKKIRARYCTDNLSVARRISDYLVEHGATLELLAIVDTGQGRDGAVPSDIPGLAVELASLPGVTFGGILTHEGHAYKQTTPEALTNVAIEAGKTMVGLADEIRSRGVDVPTVSVGSTATAHIICNVAGITEIRPGGYPFYDYGQVALGTAEVSDCSAVVVARVVSSPAPGRALVDAGSNMLGTVALSSMIASDRDVFGLVLDRPGWDMHALSEEHGWLRWTGTGPVPRLEPGEQVAILPVHICFAFHATGRSTLVREGRSIKVCTATARGHSL